MSRNFDNKDNKDNKNILKIIPDVILKYLKNKGQDNAYIESLEEFSFELQDQKKIKNTSFATISKTIKEYLETQTKKGITELDLSQIAGFVDDSLLAFIALKFPNLTRLNISGCNNITDKGLENLRALSFLKSMSIENCRRITPDNLNNLLSLSLFQLNSLKFNIAGLSKIGSDFVKEVEGRDKIVRILSSLKDRTPLDHEKFIDKYLADLKNNDQEYQYDSDQEYNIENKEEKKLPDNNQGIADIYKEENSEINDNFRLVLSNIQSKSVNFNNACFTDSITENEISSLNSELQEFVLNPKMKYMLIPAGQSSIFAITKESGVYKILHCYSDSLELEEAQKLKSDLTETLNATLMNNSIRASIKSRSNVFNEFEDQASNTTFLTFVTLHILNNVNDLRNDRNITLNGEKYDIDKDKNTILATVNHEIDLKEQKEREQKEREQKEREQKKRLKELTFKKFVDLSSEFKESLNSNDFTKGFELLKTGIYLSPSSSEQIHKKYLQENQDEKKSRLNGKQLQSLNNIKQIINYNDELNAIFKGFFISSKIGEEEINKIDGILTSNKNLKVPVIDEKGRPLASRILMHLKSDDKSVDRFLELNTSIDKDDLLREDHKGRDLLNIALDKYSDAKTKKEKEAMGRIISAVTEKIVTNYFDPDSVIRASVNKFLGHKDSAKRHEAIDKFIEPKLKENLKLEDFKSATTSKEKSRNSNNVLLHEYKAPSSHTASGSTSKFRIEGQKQKQQ